MGLEGTHIFLEQPVAWLERTLPLTEGPFITVATPLSATGLSRLSPSRALQPHRILKDPMKGFFSLLCLMALSGNGNAGFLSIKMTT